MNSIRAICWQVDRLLCELCHAAVVFLVSNFK